MLETYSRLTRERCICDLVLSKPFVQRHELLVTTLVTLGQQERYRHWYLFGLLYGMISRAELQEAMAKRLSDTMKEKGIAPTDLAKKAGTSKQQIYKLERGQVRLSDEWARKLAPHLSVRPEWLLFLDGDMEPVFTVSDDVVGPPSYLPVPTLDVRAGAGGGGIINGAYLGSPRYFEAGFITQELRASPEDLCLVEIEGQSMEPLLRHGDTVLVDRRKTNLSMEGIFVLFDGDGVVCKWVEIDRDKDVPTLKIRSENPRFKDYDVLAENCQILGRVVWFGRRI